MARQADTLSRFFFAPAAEDVLRLFPGHDLAPRAISFVRGSEHQWVSRERRRLLRLLRLLRA